MMRDRRGRGSCAKLLSTRFRTGPTPVPSFTKEERTTSVQHREPSTKSHQAHWGSNLMRFCLKSRTMCTLKRGRVGPFGGLSRCRLSRISASSVPRCGAVPIASSSVKQCAVRSIRSAVGTQYRAPRQCDDYPCASAEQVLTRLAHYYVVSGTARVSHGSVREAIAFASNLGNAAVTTIDATSWHRLR